MNMAGMAIDVIYREVIAISVGFIAWCSKTYFNAGEIVGASLEQNLENTISEPEATFDDSPHTTFKTVNEILHTDAFVQPIIQKNTVMYANTVRVPVYKNPTVEFDAQIGEIPYGEMVIVLEPKGRFYRIMWHTTEGWVFRDDIADRAMRVHPEFVVGEENLVDGLNTTHVRAILGDVFGLGRSEFPLQAGEYVLYRLWKKGISIHWPETRPRVPGLWYKILKGIPHVHVGVVPKMGSIMEYISDADTGHLAFVEAVFPDDTISVSEVNFPDSGIYNERELSQDEWKELKPVFIAVS